MYSFIHPLKRHLWRAFYALDVRDTMMAHWGGVYTSNKELPKVIDDSKPWLVIEGKVTDYFQSRSDLVEIFKEGLPDIWVNI